MALGFTALGSVIISYSLEASKEIGRVIYQAYGGQILDGINQALPGQNSEKYKRELVYDVIGDVIHKVLVDDIGNTLWSTVWGCGIAVLILALIQVSRLKMITAISIFSIFSFSRWLLTRSSSWLQ